MSGSSPGAVASVSAPFRAAARRLIGEEVFERFSKRFGPDYRDPLFKLSADEHLAVALYTSFNGYHLSINQGLWSGSPDADVLLIGRVLRAAVQKLPRYRGLVYRGFQPQESVAEMAKGYAVGQRREWPGFTSATSRLDRQFSGSVLFVIESRNGRVLREVSEVREEDEVLFLPGTAFEVVNAVSAKERLILEMREV